MSLLYLCTRLTLFPLRFFMLALCLAPLDCIGVKTFSPLTDNVYFTNSSLSISNLSLVNNVLQLEFSLRLGAPLPSHRRHAVRAYLLDSAGYFAKDNSTWSADPSSGNQLGVISNQEVVGKVFRPLNATNATNTTASFLLQLGYWTESSAVELLVELSIVDGEVLFFPPNTTQSPIPSNSTYFLAPLCVRACVRACVRVSKQLCFGWLETTRPPEGPRLRWKDRIAVYAVYCSV